MENAMELISATDYGDTWRLEVERDGNKRAIAIRNP